MMYVMTAEQVNELLARLGVPEAELVQVGDPTGEGLYKLFSALIDRLEAAAPRPGPMIGPGPAR